MDFNQLAFYSPELTQEDIHRVPQRVPQRSLYNFAYSSETGLKETLALVDKISLEKLHEVIRFARRMRDLISAVRDRDRYLEDMFEEMAEVQAIVEAGVAAANAPGVVAPDAGAP